MSLELITISLFLTLTFSGLNTDLFVILLQSSQVLTSLRELTFLHTLTDIPVDERALGVHEIEFVVDTGEHLRNSGRVGDHTHSTHDLCQVATRNNGRGLVVDTALETSGRPVNKLDGPLGLDGSDRGVDVLGDDITTVHQATGHVLSVTRI